MSDRQRFDYRDEPITFLEFAEMVVGCLVVVIGVPCCVLWWLR